MTINMERIHSQHFTVHMKPITNPGEGLKTMQPHYLRAKHGVATSTNKGFIIRSDLFIFMRGIAAGRVIMIIMRFVSYTR